MEQSGYILVSVVGKTDPIRSEHDGPILHIIRKYRPGRVVLLITKEIEKDEREYHYMEDAIHLLDSECIVECYMTGIENPHSYDDFSWSFLDICNQVKKQFPEQKILLNITSGTPQMETALCMIAIADSERFLPVQVATPEKSSNKSAFFNPKEDLIEEWFEINLDNEEGIESRCHVPQLLNYKRPVVQFQIESLIKNYDYAGAYQLYQMNRGNFSERVGILLEHARDRLNLKEKEAERYAEILGISHQVYPVARRDIRQLTEFYNSMCVKQIRGELNDFSLRIEIFTEYFGLYILQNCMRVKIEDITTHSKKETKKPIQYYLSEEKCTAKIHGIGGFLDGKFRDEKNGRSGKFVWGKPISAQHIVYIIEYLSREPQFEKYQDCVKEMLKWLEIIRLVRNPTAHTIVAIEEENFRNAYEGKDSEKLCQNMKKCMVQIFGKEVKEDAFEIYDKLNQMLSEYLQDGEA